MARNIALAATVLLGALSFAGTSAAQQDALAELYGRGVHAYFDDDYEQAHELLSDVIEEGTRDPRVYFFRGLSYSMTGRPDEAAADFKKASQLEATATERVYDVPRALQRIQGPLRLEIEEHRQKARLNARTVAGRRARARYEQFQRDQEGAVLSPDAGERRPATSGTRPGAGDETADDPFLDRQPAAAPDTAAPDATEGAPTADESAAEDDPFNEGDPDDSGAAGAGAGAGAATTGGAGQADPFTPKRPMPNTPDTTMPPTAAEGATEPDTTEPDVFEPDTTEPNTTEPNTTEPNTTEPDAAETEATEPDAFSPEATEPDATQPDAAEPDAFSPDATEPDKGPDAAGGGAGPANGGGRRKGALGGLFRALVPDVPEISIPDQISGLQIPGIGGPAGPAQPPPEEETIDPFENNKPAGPDTEVIPGDDVEVVPDEDASAAPDIDAETVPDEESDPFEKKP